VGNDRPHEPKRDEDNEYAERAPEHGVRSTQPCLGGQVSEPVSDNESRGLADTQHHEDNEEGDKRTLQPRLIRERRSNTRTEGDADDESEKSTAELEHLTHQTPSPAPIGGARRKENTEQIDDVHSVDAQAGLECSKGQAEADQRRKPEHCPRDLAPSF
jgi:hypothetical protein